MKRRVTAVLLVMVGACAGDPADDRVGAPGGDLAAPGPLPGRTGAPGPSGFSAQPFAPGEAEILITDLVAPQGLAIDGMTVYYTDLIDAALPQSIVLALAKSGGNPAPIAADDPHAARVAVDDLAVYWTDVAAGRVLRAEKLGGPEKVVLDRLAGPAYLALGERDLYVGGFYDGMVMRASKDGAAAAPLVQLERPGPMVARGDHLFLVDRKGGLIARIDVLSGELDKLASDQAPAANIAVDDTHVYWTDGQARAVLRVPRDGGAVELVAKDQFEPRGIAVVAGFVYWVDQSDGSVRRWDKRGGDPVTLVTGQSAPTELVGDYSGLYWINAGAGTIAHLP